MKILFLTHYARLYGANKSLLSICDRMKDNYEVHVLLPLSGELSEELKNRNIKYHIRPYISSFDKRTNSLRFIRRIRYLPRLLKLVIYLKPDVIYTNTSVIDYGAFLSLIYRIPHIWHIREYGDKDYGVTYDAGKRISRFLLKKTDALITISKSLQEYLPQELDSFLVYNGVPIMEQTQITPRVLPKKTTSSIVGLLHPSKGHKLAIKAFANLMRQNYQAQLIIAGKGNEEYTSSLFDIAKAEGIEDAVLFLGYQKKIEEVYNRTDVLLMCSDFEAFGRVTVEAMSYGIPVIGKASGGTPEIISHRENGLLFNTEEELSSQMLELITNSELYRKLSKNALTSVATKFSEKKYTENIAQLIDRIAENSI